VDCLPACCSDRDSQADSNPDNLETSRSEALQVSAVREDGETGQPDAGDSPPSDVNKSGMPTVEEAPAVRSPDQDESSAHLRKQLLEMRSQNEKLELRVQELSDAKKENESLSARNAEIEAQVVELLSRASSLEGDLSALQGKEKATRNELNDMKLKVRKLNLELDEAQKISVRDDSLASVSAEAIEDQERIKKLERKLKAKENELKAKAGQFHGSVTEQLMSLPPEQLQGIMSQVLKTLPSEFFEALITAQLLSLPSDERRGITLELLQAIPAEDTKAVVSAQLQGVPAEHLAALLTEQLSGRASKEKLIIVGEQLKSLPAEQVGVIIAEHMRTLPAGMQGGVLAQLLKAMPTSQLSLAMAEHLRSISHEDRQSLLIQQLKALPCDELQRIVCEYLKSLTSEEQKALVASQLSSLSTEEMEAVLAAQLSAMTIEARTALAPELSGVARATNKGVRLQQHCVEFIKYIRKELHILRTVVSRFPHEVTMPAILKLSDSVQKMATQSEAQEAQRLNELRAQLERVETKALADKKALQSQLLAKHQEMRHLLARSGQVDEDFFIDARSRTSTPLRPAKTRQASLDPSWKRCGSISAHSKPRFSGTAPPIPSPPSTPNPSRSSTNYVSPPPSVSEGPSRRCSERSETSPASSPHGQRTASSEMPNPCEPVKVDEQSMQSSVRTSREHDMAQREHDSLTTAIILEELRMAEEELARLSHTISTRRRKEAVDVVVSDQSGEEMEPMHQPDDAGETIDASLVAEKDQPTFEERIPREEEKSMHLNQLAHGKAHPSRQSEEEDRVPQKSEKDNVPQQSDRRDLHPQRADGRTLSPQRADGRERRPQISDGKEHHPQRADGKEHHPQRAERGKRSPQTTEESAHPPRAQKGHVGASSSNISSQATLSSSRRETEQSVANECHSLESMKSSSFDGLDEGSYRRTGSRHASTREMRRVIASNATKRARDVAERGAASEPDADVSGLGVTIQQNAVEPLSKRIAPAMPQQPSPEPVRRIHRSRVHGAFRLTDSDSADSNAPHLVKADSALVAENNPDHKSEHDASAVNMAKMPSIANARVHSGARRVSTREITQLSSNESEALEGKVDDVACSSTELCTVSESGRNLVVDPELMEMLGSTIRELAKAREEVESALLAPRYIPHIAPEEGTLNDGHGIHMPSPPSSKNPINGLGIQMPVPPRKLPTSDCSVRMPASPNILFDNGAAFRLPVPPSILPPTNLQRKIFDSVHPKLEVSTLSLPQQESSDALGKPRTPQEAFEQGFLSDWLSRRSSSAGLVSSTAAMVENDGDALQHIRHQRHDDQHTSVREKAYRHEDSVERQASVDKHQHGLTNRRAPNPTSSHSSRNQEASAGHPNPGRARSTVGGARSACLASSSQHGEGLPFDGNLRRSLQEGSCSTSPPLASTSDHGAASPRSTFYNRNTPEDHRATIALNHELRPWHELMKSDYVALRQEAFREPGGQTTALLGHLNRARGVNGLDTSPRVSASSFGSPRSTGSRLGNQTAGSRLGSQTSREASLPSSCGHRPPSMLPNISDAGYVSDLRRGSGNSSARF